MPDHAPVRWRHRVRTRLTIAVTLAIIAPMLVFFFSSIKVSTRMQLAETENELETIALHATSTLDMVFRELARDLQPSEYDPDMLSLSPKELNLFLFFLLHRLPDVDGVSFVGLEGKELARSSYFTVYFPGRLRDLAGSQLLATVKRGETFFDRPQIGEETNHPRMTIAIPDYDGRGALDGAILGEVSLRKVFDRVRIQLARTPDAYIVDDAGTVIAHPNHSLVLKRVDLSYMQLVAEALKLAPDGMTRMMRYANAEGRDVFGLGRRTKRGWVFISEIPSDTALAGPRETTRIFSAIFASAALIGIAASLLIGSRATRTLLTIQRSAEAIGSGDFTKHVPEVSVGELGELERNLNIMASKLEEYYHHLESDMDILNQKVAERTESLQKAYNDLKARDEELRRTQAALVHTEKLASLGLLVAGVVHEVNNPLAFVLNNVEVLRRDVAVITEVARAYNSAAAAADEKERTRLLREAADVSQKISFDETVEALQRVLASTLDGLTRIRKIVADLRDFSRTGEMVMEPTDLARLAETTLTILAYELKKKQIQVTKDYGDLPPVPVAPGKISQVLLNILMNAIQAAPEHGHIRITAAVEDGWAVIRVRDDGHGIPEEAITRIFDPFFTTRPRGEGTGLGLTVSYGIIKEHGGTITVASKPGQGAEFTVRLPLTAAEKT